MGWNGVPWTSSSLKAQQAAPQALPLSSLSQFKCLHFRNSKCRVETPFQPSAFSSSLSNSGTKASIYSTLSDHSIQPSKLTYGEAKAWNEEWTCLNLLSKLAVELAQGSRCVDFQPTVLFSQCMFAILLDLQIPLTLETSKFPPEMS